MPMPPADAAITATATTIADLLGETKHRPRAQIWRIVRELGIESAHALLAEVQTIEAGEGMLTPDGVRRRTPGGVFLFLASQRLSANARNRVFYYRQHVKQRVQTNAAQALTTTTELLDTPPVTWADRLADHATLLATPGAASVMMTLIGHPLEQQDVGAYSKVLLPPMTLPPLPKGLPVPDVMSLPSPPAFITRKQWKGNTSALTVPEAILILEGVCGETSPEGIPFLTMSATTKRRQAIKATTTLKVTVTGRLGAVVAKSTYVATLITLSRLPALPKGLPASDSARLPQILIFIATKQWEALGASHEADDLFIEGFGVPEPALPGLIMFATRISHRNAKTTRSPA